MDHCSDEHLRKMRDAVYPAQVPKQVQDDASWEHVKKNWRSDEEWLTEEYGKVIAGYAKVMRRKP